MGENQSSESRIEPRFIHLRCASAYSLSEGAIRVKELVGLAKSNKMPAIGMTDTGNLFGSLEFSLAASGEGIQPIIGVVTNFTLEPYEEEVERKTGKLVLIAKDETGYYNLLKLVSRSYTEAEDAAMPIMDISFFEGAGSREGSELEKYPLAEGIIALTGGYEGLLNQAIVNDNQGMIEDVSHALMDLFGDRLYIELGRHGVPQEMHAEKPLINLAFAQNIPLVATNNCMFVDKGMFEAQDILMCIAGGHYASDMSRRRYTPEHYFKSQNEMCKLFADIPEALQNSVNIAKRCSAISPAREPMLPSMTVGSASEDDELRRIGKEGLEHRLEEVVYLAEMRARQKAADEAAGVVKAVVAIGEEGAVAEAEFTIPSLTDEEKETIAEPYWARLKFELDIICQMGFPGYFLIVSDFISWSKEMDIPVGPGRGSGAGSVVAWVMLITDLDPLRYGLLFERFLNPERVSMPDFDIDFCQDRREEVIHYVQKKYGDDRVAQIITFGKLQAKAVLRDVGRVLQMSYGQVDKMCKLIPFNPANPLSLQEAIDLDSTFKKEAQGDEQVAKLLEIGLKLEGMFRHAGTHAAGVVIGAVPLDELVPLYQDPRMQLPATQYSMKYAEMAGLVKFDFLGLKTLTTISNVCNIVREQGHEIDIDKIPIDDVASFKMLALGESTGVFQMESAGMRDALRKMRPDTIEDIIALISLYRPGPMENIPTYIARKHGLEAPDYMHPKLEPCLKETFGVIIYQEQVMEIAKVLSGYSLGGADLLRRAMGKKIAAEMDIQRALFMEGAEKNEVDPKQAGMIFDLVAKFAGYGFNKSHAAAYAWIGYQTAYLKANYPTEFLAGSMNIDIGDTDKLNIFAAEVRHNNIQLLQPDINKSRANFTVEQLPEVDAHGRKRGIRYGLAGLKGVGQEAMDALVAERDANGPFKDIFDVARRCDNRVMNKRQIEGMAKAGGFDSFGVSRRQILEGSGALCRYSQSIAQEKASSQVSLFGDEDNSLDQNPEGIMPKVTEWPSAEKWKNEYSAVGFYLTGHPLDNYAEEMKMVPGLVYSADQTKKISMDGGKYKMCGMVTGTTIRSSARGRFAYLYLSDPTGNLEMSVFNERMLDANLENFESGKPLLVTVDARRDEGGIRLQVDDIALFEDYLEAKKFKIDVYLDRNNLKKPDALGEFKQAIEKNDKGRTQIRLWVETEAEMQVECLLAGYYTVPADYRQAFLEMPVVRKISTS
jgi:DNA polymerase-3 subunit alpha